MIAARIDDLLEIAESTLTVEQITSTELHYLAPSFTVAEAIDELQTRRYDLAPVRDDTVTRFVRLVDLKSAGDDGAAIDSLALPITPRELISGSAGLAQAIERLEHQSDLFVFVRGGGLGLVTRADLHRPAVGMVVLAFILVGEAGLARLLDNKFGEHLRSGLDSALNKRTIDEVVELHRKKCSRRAETTLAESLTLGQRLDLVQANPELCDLLEYPSRGKVKADKERLNRVRDELAHAGDLLSAVGGNPAQAIEEVLAARAFAERVRNALRRIEHPEWLTSQPLPE